MISRLSLEHLKLIRKMSNRCEGLRITGCGLVDLVFNHEFLSGAVSYTHLTLPTIYSV